MTTLITIDEAIKHCEEVAEEQEDFDKFQCDYCKIGCEDGVWKETCRLPSNIPVGHSWGECSEQNCPLFPGSLECASEHRQLAEWLKELKKLKTEHKGKWINNNNDDAGEGYFICSNCKNDVYDATDYCPNCGADMRGDEE